MDTGIVGLWHCEDREDPEKDSYICFSDDDSILQLNFFENLKSELKLFVDVIDAEAVDEFELRCKHRYGGYTFPLFVRVFSDASVYLYRPDMQPKAKSWICTRIATSEIPHHRQRLMNVHRFIPRNLKT